MTDSRIGLAHLGFSMHPGVHVPLLVRWPGVAQVGQVRRELVSELDLMPPILRAADVAVPKGLTGQPIQPLLQGQPCG